MKHSDHPPTLRACSALLESGIKTIAKRPSPEPELNVISDACGTCRQRAVGFYNAGSGFRVSGPASTTVEPMATIYTRTLDIDRTRVDESSRTAPCVLSTEFAVARDGYLEVLSHAPAAVDLSRAPLPLLEQHDSRRLNIGVIEHLHLAGKKLRGTVRLGESARALELWTDIKAGVVRNLSIGYQIMNTRESGNTLTATRWQPFECSLVSVPADPGAGLYRNFPMTTETEIEHQEVPESATPILDRLTRSQKRAASTHARDERERVQQHYKFFEHFNLNSPAHLRFRDELIESGADIQVARDWARTMKADPVPTFAESFAPGRQYAVGNRSILSHFGANERDATDRAFAAGQWVRALLGNRQAQQWTGARAMSTSWASKGGAMVPDEMASAIISLVAEYGVIRAHARVWPMSSDTLSIPRRRSGVTGYYVAQNNQITASDMGLDQINLVARKFAARILMSTELGEDSAIDIAALLAEECAREFARAEDEAAFNGDGTSTYGGMVGIRSALIGTAGKVSATAGHNTFALVDQTDLTNTMSKLPSYARKGAAWFVSPEFNDLVFQRLALSAGGITLQEVAGSRVEYFRGYPIIVVEVMPAAAAAADGVVAAVFGDLRQAVAFGDRRAISVRVDDTSRLEYDQIVVQATQRFDCVAHDIGTASVAGGVVGLALKS